jgi:hypothetical protein
MDRTEPKTAIDHKVGDKQTHLTPRDLTILGKLSQKDYYVDLQETLKNLCL